MFTFTYLYISLINQLKITTMKTQIENIIIVTPETAHIVTSEFNAILYFVRTSETLTSLKNKLKGEKSNEFNFGFGGSHFWVTQKGQTNRLLIATEN